MHRSHDEKVRKLKKSLAFLDNELQTAGGRPHKALIDQMERRALEANKALRSEQEASKKSLAERDGYLTNMNMSILSQRSHSNQDMAEMVSKCNELEFHLQAETEKRLDERAAFRKQLSTIEGTLIGLSTKLQDKSVVESTAIWEASETKTGLREMEKILQAHDQQLQCAALVTSKIDYLSTKIGELGQTTARHDHALTTLGSQHQDMMTDSLRLKIAKAVNPYALTIKEMFGKIESSTTEVRSQIQRIDRARSAPSQDLMLVRKAVDDMGKRIVRLETIIASTQEGFIDLRQLVHKVPTTNELQHLAHQVRQVAGSYTGVQQRVESLEGKVSDHVAMVDNDRQKCLANSSRLNSDSKSAEEAFTSELDSIRDGYKKTDTMVQELQAGQISLSDNVMRRKSQDTVLQPIRNGAGTQAKSLSEAHTQTHALKRHKDGSREAKTTIHGLKGPLSLKRKLDDGEANTTDENSTSSEARRRRKSRKHKRKRVQEIISLDD